LPGREPARAARPDAPDGPRVGLAAGARAAPALAPLPAAEPGLSHPARRPEDARVAAGHVWCHAQRERRQRLAADALTPVLRPARPLGAAPASEVFGGVGCRGRGLARSSVAESPPGRSPISPPS